MAKKIEKSEIEFRLIDGVFRSVNLRQSSVFLGDYLYMLGLPSLPEGCEFCRIKDGSRCIEYRAYSYGVVTITLYKML